MSLLGGWGSKEEEGRKNVPETKRNMAGLTEGMRKYWLPPLKEQ